MKDDDDDDDKRFDEEEVGCSYHYQKKKKEDDEDNDKKVSEEGAQGDGKRVTFESDDEKIKNGSLYKKEKTKLSKKLEEKILRTYQSRKLIK